MAEPEKQPEAGKNEAPKQNANKEIFKNLFLRVSLQDRVLFARHLAVGLRSGMTLQDSLQLIRKQTKSTSFKKILDSIMNDTANGMFLSSAMEKYQGIFGELFINIVRVAENSGTLTENLNYLAVELKKKQELRNKIRGALIYPAIIFIATIGIVITLMVGVFPKILPVFTSLRVNLPLSTRIVIVSSKFLTTNLAWVIVGVIFFVGIMWIISHYYWFRHAWCHLLLKMPIIGGMSVKVNAANMARTLGLLLKSGVKIIEAVNITAETMDNLAYRHELKNAGETLRRGDYFSSYLDKHPKLFPPILVNMIEVGENTGNLTENLAYLSEFYQGDVEEFLKNISSIIEPLLLLFMGLLVGFIALSVITPIYQISQTLTL
jgi:type IV pilus assembly protein PilC